MNDDAIRSTGKDHSCDLSCPVEHVMRGAPVVDPETTLRSTAQAMVADRAGAAIVRGPDGPTNIVTEGDVVRALADGADPDIIWAADVASTRLVSVSPGATLADAVRRMSEEGIHHVPVKVRR